MRTDLFHLPCLRQTAVMLLMGLGLLQASAQETTGERLLCEYQTVPSIAADTGDVRLTRQRISEQECDEMGAAVGELSPGWRQRLPQRVRWLQRSDSASLCRHQRTEWGQRQDSQLEGQGCVFVQAPEACTIISSLALSHAQLANAVRDCAH